MEAKTYEVLVALVEALTEIGGHAGAAVSQSIPSDDAIIINHLRKIQALARAAISKAKEAA
jgi:hypothetical protein